MVETWEASSRVLLDKRTLEEIFAGFTPTSANLGFVPGISSVAELDKILSFLLFVETFRYYCKS